VSHWRCVVAGRQAATRIQIEPYNWESLDAPGPEEPPRPIVSGRADACHSTAAFGNDLLIPPLGKSATLGLLRTPGASIKASLRSSPGRHLDVVRPERLNSKGRQHGVSKRMF